MNGMQKYNKAIVAVLGGLVTLLAPVIPGIDTVIDAEIIQAAATILTPILVYAIPNIDGEKA